MYRASVQDSLRGLRDELHAAMQVHICDIYVIRDIYVICDI